MIRKTLTIFSLLGFLLSVGLWGVSFFYILVVQAFSGYAGVFNGMIAISNLRYDEHLGHVVCRAYDWSQLSPDERWAWLPFIDSYFGLWEIGIPLWIPLCLFAACPLYSTSPLARRRKRKKLGLCLKCGYDLRGSKNICPECGEEFESSGV